MGEDIVWTCLWSELFFPTCWRKTLSESAYANVTDYVVVFTNRGRHCLNLLVVSTDLPKDVRTYVCNYVRTYVRTYARLMVSGYSSRIKKTTCHCGDGVEVFLVTPPDRWVTLTVQYLRYITVAACCSDTGKCPSQFEEWIVDGRGCPAAVVRLIP